MDKIKASQFADLAYYSRQPTLPSAFQQVEYIETPTNGSTILSKPYLIIDYYPNAYTEYDVKMSLKIWVDSKVLFGLYEDSGYKFDVQTTSSSSQALYVNTGNIIELNIGSGQHLNLVTNQNVLTNNGVDFAISKSSITATHKLAIFTCYSSGSNNYTSYVSPSTLNYFRVYENNKKVIDLIPAVRNSDKIAGAYDLVNRKFYTNSGTGDFAVGGNV